MWLKYLVITLLFYFFAILQNSFLIHFNVFGITPNFILIFYFLLLYFSPYGGPALGWENSFYAIIAGFFLDVFLHSYFGVSIISLLITMFLVKKALQLLWNRGDEHTLLYFIPLFAVYLVIYDAFLNIILFFSSPSFVNFNANWTFIITLVYNMAFALLGFYICKKFNLFKDLDRQLKLF